MRLLLTTDTVGGVWTFTSVLVSAFLKRGIDVVLVSFGGAPSIDQQTTVKKQETLGNIRYIASETALEWMTPNSDAYEAAAPRLQDICHSFTPDALLLSQFCFGALPVRTPKIVIAHSDVLSWASAVGKAPLPVDSWLKTYCSLVESGLSGADLLVSPTKAALDGMARHFQLPCPRLVIPNGRRMLPSTKSTPHRQLQAVTAGRMWDPAKNMTLLMKVRWPVPLVIAGEYRDFAGRHANLTLVGRLDEAELRDTLLGSAIYICCSVYEPFGLAPLEAALCGCAVLAYDIPSLREVWGDAALYFHDAQTLEDLLNMLANQPARLAEAQSISFARAQTFTPERTADGYLNAVRMLMEAKEGDQFRAA